MQHARYDAAQLLANHPPVFGSEQKRALFARTTPPASAHRGTIEVTRHGPRALPNAFDPERMPSLRVEPGVFEYRETDDATDWYLNFAHHDLFCCYGTVLFAQDELQVAEHPALASLREALLDDGTVTPRTVEDGRPTPVLIRGIERHAAIDTRTLYGHRFARATPAAMDSAVKRLDPATRSNLLAIEAPYGHRGRYTHRQIEFILTTAFTGFAAAVEASDHRAVVHTGFWGCGAYGGNRVLMPLLQLAAANLARVDEVVFYAVDDGGLEDFERARAALRAISPHRITVSSFCDDVVERGFEWGISNGT